MARCKLRNMRARRKAGLGADGTIMAAAIGLQTASQVAQMISSRNATIQNAKTQADAQTHAAQIQANALAQQNDVANRNTEKQIEVQRDAQAENRDIQNNYYQSLQMMMGQQNQNDRLEASKIQVRNGGTAKRNGEKVSTGTSFIQGGYGTLPFRVTDGGAAIPIGQTPEGYTMYELYGNDHNHYHKTKGGKYKSGVGLKFADGSVIEGEGNQHKPHGEIVVPTENDALIFSNHDKTFDGVSPARMLRAGYPLGYTWNRQEITKAIKGLSDDGKHNTNSPVKKMLAMNGTQLNPLVYNVGLGMPTTLIGANMYRPMLRNGGRVKAGLGDWLGRQWDDIVNTFNQNQPEERSAPARVLYGLANIGNRMFNDTIDYVTKDNPIAQTINNSAFGQAIDKKINQFKDLYQNNIGYKFDEIENNPKTQANNEAANRILDAIRSTKVGDTILGLGSLAMALPIVPESKLAELGLKGITAEGLEQLAKEDFNKNASTAARNMMHHYEPFNTPRLQSELSELQKHNWTKEMERRQYLAENSLRDTKPRNTEPINTSEATNTASNGTTSPKQPKDKGSRWNRVKRKAKVAIKRTIPNYFNDNSEQFAVKGLNKLIKGTGIVGGLSASSLIGSRFLGNSGHRVSDDEYNNAADSFANSYGYNYYDSINNVKHKNPKLDRRGKKKYGGRIKAGNGDIWIPGFGYTNIDNYSSNPMGFYPLTSRNPIMVNPELRSGMGNSTYYFNGSYHPVGADGVYLNEVSVTGVPPTRKLNFAVPSTEVGDIKVQPVDVNGNGVISPKTKGGWSSANTMALVGGLTNFATNLIGANVINHANNKASGILGNAYNKAGELIADAYGKWHGVDLSKINKDDFEPGVAMAGIVGYTDRSNQPVTQINRQRDAYNKNAMRYSISGSSALQRQLANNINAADARNQVYQNEANRLSEIEKINAANTTQASIANALNKQQSNNSYYGMLLDAMKFNAETDNAAISGAAQAKADALTNAAGAKGNAYMSNGNAWGNAIAAGGQGLANAFNTIGNYNSNFQNSMVGATTNAAYYTALGTKNKYLASVLYDSFVNSADPVYRQYAQNLVNAGLVNPKK